jgi:hypothetical protein
MMAASVNDRCLARRLPAQVRDAGFEVGAFRSHGFAETTEAACMLTVVDRGADILYGDGRVGEDLREALKAEARRRLGAGTFLEHVAYASCHATKPTPLTTAARRRTSVPMAGPRPARSEWTMRARSRCHRGGARQPIAIFRARPLSPRLTGARRVPGLIE